MKTQKFIPGKMMTTVILLTSLFTFAACGQQKNTEKGAAQSVTSQKSQNPPKMDIHTASLMGNLDAIRQHIQTGSDLNKKDAYGSSPLTIATTFGKTEVAKALIEAGANVNIKSKDGSTPLHTAAFFCRTEIVKALLANGADKNIRNSYGSTALESVSAPFNDVKGIYDQLSRDLGPLGLKLDYGHLETTRPKIAELLR